MQDSFIMIDTLPWCRYNAPMFQRMKKFRLTACATSGG